MRGNDYIRHIEAVHTKRKEETMKNVTLTQIRKSVEAAGGTYKKCKFYLNGNDAYEVNGKTYTKTQMIEAYRMGDL